MNYEFEIHASAKDFSGDPENTLDLLFEAGLDDALIEWSGDNLTIQFDREATNLGAAIASAITNIESVSGLRVLRALPIDLVNSAEISRRKGKTRPWASQIIAGKRGPGDFPESYPMDRLPTQMWRWADVEAWFDEGAQPDRQAIVHESLFLTIMNAALEVRNTSMRAELVDEDRASVFALVGQAQLV